MRSDNPRKRKGRFRKRKGKGNKILVKVEPELGNIIKQYDTGKRCTCSQNLRLCTDGKLNGILVDCLYFLLCNLSINVECTKMREITQMRRFVNDSFLFLGKTFIFCTGKEQMESVSLHIITRTIWKRNMSLTKRRKR